MHALKEKREFVKNTYARTCAQGMHPNAPTRSSHVWIIFMFTYLPLKATTAAQRLAILPDDLQKNLWQK
jgi:hypothetical protein